VSTSTYDKLVVTDTPKGSRIGGFVKGKTQARLVFTRHGEQMEMLCLTEELACAELGAIETLSGWELVSAHLVRFRQPHRPRHAAANGQDGAADVAGAESAAAA
jgi:hypothetical protein